MELKDAWLTLGKDPEEIYNKIAAQSSISSKIEEAFNLLHFAKKIAKKLLAQSHPDRNPGDAEAESRFKRIQQALSSIEYHTNEFKIKAMQKTNDEQMDEEGNCYIRFE